MSTWTNFDGLDIDYGLTRSMVNKTGTTAESTMRTLTVDVDWEDISTVASHIANINARDAFIPAGAYIKSATFNVTEGFVGATATLGIGIGGADGSTVIDADGIDVAIAVTALNTVGDQVLCNGALVGGLVSIGTADGYVYFTTGTAAWTAGTGRLVIEYLTDGT